MAAGDPFTNAFTTSGTVSLAPIGHNVMLTSIMTSSDNGRLDMGGGYYAVFPEQSNGGSSPSSTTEMSKWTGGMLLNAKIFMTPTVFLSLNSSSGTVKFHYSGVQM
tara:strand:- start:252 stop:569 length:318 start_codon:yes stop_codon:yes gene_type:complete